MLKRRGNDRFHVVSTWNPRGVFVGLLGICIYYYVQSTYVMTQKNQIASFE